MAGLEVSPYLRQAQHLGLKSTGGLEAVRFEGDVLHPLHLEAILV